jgi:hypothetical protein
MRSHRERGGLPAGPVAQSQDMLASCRRSMPSASCLRLGQDVKAISVGGGGGTRDSSAGQCGSVRRELPAETRQPVLPMRPRSTEGWPEKRAVGFAARHTMIGVTLPAEPRS